MRIHRETLECIVQCAIQDQEGREGKIGEVFEGQIKHMESAFLATLKKVKEALKQGEEIEIYGK